MKKPSLKEVLELLGAFANETFWQGVYYEPLEQWKNSPEYKKRSQEVYDEQVKKAQAARDSLTVKLKELVDE